MTDLKTTPGPWTIVEYGDEDDPSLVIHSSPYNRVCFMSRPGKSGSQEEIEANANLISAALELYGALRELVDLNAANEFDVLIQSGELSAALDKADIALAKARGVK